jgi:hypothetical protein
MAALALFAGLPSGLLVLCVGSAGHVAVEFGGGPAVARAADASGAGGLTSCDACDCGDDCGPCEDSGFDSGGPTLRARASEWNARLDATPGVVFAPLPGAAHPGAAWRRFVPPPAACATLSRHVRTTVLLI